MRTIAIAALVIAGACRAEPSNDRNLVVLPELLTLRDTLTVDATTWFVVSFDAPRSPLLCRLENATLTCGAIPTLGGRARIVEPGPGARLLVAVPAGDGVRYLEPFTWREARRLDDIDVRSHAVVLRDGTLWIEDSMNLVVARPGEAPRRWFAADASRTEVALAGTTALWIEHRGARRVFSVARVGLHGLGPIAEYPDLGPWKTRPCRAGDTVAMIDGLHRELVLLDLASGSIRRGWAGGDTHVRCRPGVAVAAPFRIGRDGPDHIGSWCDERECRLAEAGATSDWSGDFAAVDRGILGVGSTLDGQLVTWKLGERPRLTRVRGSRGLVQAQAAATASGVLVVFHTGEVLVLDHEGRVQPIALTTTSGG